MQDRPDKAVLLDALAAFLATEVKDVITDPALRFRVLIAAHLAAVVAHELRSEDDHDARELRSLAALLGEGVPSELPSSRAERQKLFARLSADLAAEIRRGALEDRALEEHFVATLRDKLSVVNPRFDLSRKIE